jgi:hypothetical protein
MQAEILTLADLLETKIRAFLDKCPDGGKFVFSKEGIKRIRYNNMVIPLLMETFEEEGWRVSYDFSLDDQWFEIKRPLMLTMGAHKSS